MGGIISLIMTATTMPKSTPAKASPREWPMLSRNVSPFFPRNSSGREKLFDQLINTLSMQAGLPAHTSGIVNHNGSNCQR